MHDYLNIVTRGGWKRKAGWTLKTHRRFCCNDCKHLNRNRVRVSQFGNGYQYLYGCNRRTSNFVVGSVTSYRDINRQLCEMGCSDWR